MLIPLIFFVVAIGLGIFTFSVVYPSAETGIPEPYYSTMTMDTSAPIYSVGVAIEQKTPTTAAVGISIELVHSASARPESGSVLLILPTGITFNCDPHADCHNYTSVAPSVEIERLRFKSGYAFCAFFINRHNFSVNFDDINAYAAIPGVILHLKGSGSENPLMAVGFHIPAAASYDWSSFPSRERGSNIDWIEPLVKGETPGRVIDGTNHARQKTDANLTFLAGALIGIAGAALLIGFQEAMHVSDEDD